MKRHVIIATQVFLMIASSVALAPPADARSPGFYIVGDKGFFGVDADGGFHYVLTSDGFRLYDISTYGYCGRHHRHHTCRYVNPMQYRHPKHKHPKCKESKHRKERKKYYKKLRKEQKKYYKKHERRHRHDHDDD